MSVITRTARRYPRRAALAGLLAAVFYVLIFIYPFVEISLKLMHIPSAVITLLALIPFAGSIINHYVPGSIGRAASRISYTLTGAMLLYSLVRLACELVSWVAFSENSDIWPLQWALKITAVIWGFSLYNAQRLRTKTINISSPKISRPYKIIQISDVHLGSRHQAFLPRVLKEVKKSEPELLLITGDFIDMDGITEAHLEPLKSVNCPIYFIIGNHERYVDLNTILRNLSRTGVNILRNETAHWNEIQLIGIDDAESKRKVARELPGIQRNTEMFQLLMYHRPDGFKFAAESGIDLMLCGHTHNGQVIPVNFLVKRVFKRIMGVYKHGNSTLYVSPGTGTWGPVMRLGSRNEVTKILLGPG